jgi:hypothetical protein
MVGFVLLVLCVFVVSMGVNESMYSLEIPMVCDGGCGWPVATRALLIYYTQHHSPSFTPNNSLVTPITVPLGFCCAGSRARP